MTALVSTVPLWLVTIVDISVNQTFTKHKAGWFENVEAATMKEFQAVSRGVGDRVTIEYVGMIDVVMP